MKTVSFIIPVYNEQNRIHKTMEALNTLTLSKELTLTEVIFVDDGSTDDTLFLVKRAKTTILKRFKKRYKNTKITILSYRKNRGKGFAIKQGMIHTTADYALFFDADMSTPLSQIEKFVPFMKNDIAVIIGTRKNGKSTVILHQPLIREMMGRMFTKIARYILQVETSDFTCGFKAFSKVAREQIFSLSQIKRWGYDGEIMYLAKKYHFSWQEKAVIWSNDPNTKVKMAQAAIQTLIELMLIYWYHEINPTYTKVKKMLRQTILSLPFAGRIASFML